MTFADSPQTPRANQNAYVPARTPGSLAPNQGFSYAHAAHKGSQYTAPPQHVQDEENLQRAFGNLDMNDSTNLVNPSMAPVAQPAPSQVLVEPPKPPPGKSRIGYSTYWAPRGHNDPKWLKTDICFKAPYSRSTFNLGDVIAIPYHVSNMDEYADPNDLHIAINKEYGPIYSKRRMFVVVHKNFASLFCLPLYSHKGSGMKKYLDNDDHMKEVIEVRDVIYRGAQGRWIQQHKFYNPLDFVHKDSPRNCLIKETIVHLSGGVRIDWHEPATYVGRFTQRSHEALVKYYLQVQRKAQAEVCTNWPKVGTNPRMNTDYLRGK